MRITLLLLFLSGYFAQAQKTVIEGVLKNAPRNFLEVSYAEGEQFKTDTIHLTEKGEWKYVFKAKESKCLRFFTGTDGFRLVVKSNDKLNVSADNEFFDESLFVSGDGAQANILLNKLFLIQEEAMIIISRAVYNVDSLSVIQEFLTKMNHLNPCAESLRRDFPELAVGLPTSSEISDLTSAILTDYRSSYQFSQRANTLYGQVIPDLQLTNDRGELISIRSFAGKVTLIDFWTDWCSVCIENFPELKRLEEKYEGELQVVSLGINMSFSYENWLKKAPEFGFKSGYFVANNQNEIGQLLGISFLPRYILLDANQKIIQPLAPMPDSKLLEPYIQEMLGR